jgi:thiamine transport system ATP-binding protein
MLELDGLAIDQTDFHLNADFGVPQGARVAVIGPSGAGKSTLLGAIAGFVAHRGQIRWQGAAIHALPPARRPLSILFQDHNLLPHLTAFDNAALGLSPRLRLAAPDRARVTAALAAVGLQGLDSRRPAQLSGGQMGRVALARVLLRDRPLLLLDEPFSALGPALKAEMLDLVARLCAQKGLTLLMVTHDPADARRLCPQTVVVAEGRAAPPVDTAQLLAAPPPALRAYLGGA